MIAFVVIHNLFEREILDEKKTKEIEEIVCGAMVGVAGEKATQENVIFSFPLDPSVDTIEIPLVAEITLFPSYHGNRPDRRLLGGKIKDRLRSFLREKDGKIVVIVKTIDPEDTIISL